MKNHRQVKKRKKTKLVVKSRVTSQNPVQEINQEANGGNLDPPHHSRFQLAVFRADPFLS